MAKESSLNREVQDKVMTLTSDEASIVRLQLALSLGECESATAIAVLADLARSHADEQWMRMAILSAVPTRAGELFLSLTQSPAELGQADSVCEALCSAIARRSDSRELSQTLTAVSDLGDRKLKLACLVGLRQGMSEPLQVTLSQGARTAVKNLAKHADAEFRQLGRQLVTLTNAETRAEQMARLQVASETLDNVQLTTEKRIQAAIELAETGRPEYSQRLIEVLPSSTPRLQDAIIGVLIRNTQHVDKLLDAIESNEIATNLLDAVDRSTLIQSQNPKISQRAIDLFKAVNNAEDIRYEGYEAALKQPRNIARGKVVFEKHCSRCHQAHGVGQAVGPDLNSEFLRAEETIIQDVLSPSGKITAGYSTYLVSTQSGRLLTGILAEESPTSITLRQAEGKVNVVLRKDIDQLKVMPISMMPEDLAKSITPEELADALGWLRRPPTTLLLVDDNRELAKMLNEGSGSAEFVSNEKLKGNFSLRVSPPQRYSRQIPHWNFRIRENPGLGEYRYLKFAWKTNEAHGVMIELADNGRWPPADKKLRRYHAGKNTTGWGSVDVSAKVPQKWTVVTRDLWKDFGEFTLTGWAPTTMGGPAYFDQVELLRNIDD